MQNKTSKVLMIRPVQFGFNEQTATSNSFQVNSDDLNSNQIQAKALNEFNVFVDLLRTKGIEVIVFEDTKQPTTPDSVFPNNWISFHENNTMVLYPMLAKNRRLERRNDIIDFFMSENSKIIDLTNQEKRNFFLEGTGSIVFDYVNQIAYANCSPRTDKKLLRLLCEKLNYKAITFKAIDENGKDIYHTNVLMCIGKDFAILCPESIPNKKELKQVLQSLENTGHEIIKITYQQMNSFAGNMYQLFNNSGKSCIVLSEQAYNSLNKEQIKKLEQYGELLHTPLYTIEKNGGGSARCMIADVRQ
ncbi:MAG: amidinotransferase [Bacteroidetes bacterium RIFCSPLOWO2_12_FULL_35_15]|nr:MAG: amidinotransferase [Bacteroidetes bacterium RIFCSPLOWO2_12_FULL_35_15]